MTRPLPGVPLVALRLVVLLLAGLWPSAAEPYVRTTTDTGNAIFWTEREVTLNLVLPCLPDACYEAAAIEAAQAWTDAGARFTFHTTSQSADPCNHNDGRNTVSFVDSLCGMPYPPGNLATTLTRVRISGEIIEADVVFNSGRVWEVYAGPWRSGVFEFSRVALHEFGHVLGLGHPDEYGQVVSAIMNGGPKIDRLQADDIAGIRAIYGVGVPPPPPPPSSPQREALEALYDATDGPNWTYSTNWKTPAPLADWEGVVATDADGNVTELYLSGNQLSGPLPAALGNLSQLEFLNLDTNQLSGPLPAALGNLSQLEFLYLDTNQLSGPLPAALGRLSNLKGLDLADNQLSGSIPAALGNLSQLEFLYLDTNQLSGPLPAALGNLSQLEFLYLDTNQLSGPLPATLGRLSNLKELELSDNQLSGPLPATLAHLSALEFLSLHNNAALSGVLPIGLKDLPLTDLDIRNTQIRVPTDAAFTAWLATINFSGGDPVGAAVVGALENPGGASFQSGIGVISGWVCAAATVEIEITTEGGEVGRHVASYGTGRGDTQDVCGDTNNGFGLLFNWNLLGDGAHTVVAYADAAEFGRATVTVTTLGAEFVQGVAGACVVPDFPLPGETVTLAWQETSQNFVITAGAAPAGSAPPAGSAVVGALENPGGASFQSGIGVISGWVCAAATVEIEITTEGGEVGRHVASYGTGRGDTQDVCGDTNNGFGLLFNWNLLGDGAHTVVAYADAAEFGRATVTVTTLGAEFVQGVAGACVVPDFPLPGETVTLAWQETSQNFVITQGEMGGPDSGSRVYWAIRSNDPRPQWTIHWARLDLSDAGRIDVTNIVSPERYIDELAVDPMEGSLYMLTRTYSNYHRYPDSGPDLGYSYIYRASLDGSGFEEVFRFHEKYCADNITPCQDPGYTFGDAYDMTFDSGGRKLYISITGGKMVHMYRADPGSARLELVPGQFEDSSGEDDGRNWNSVAVGEDDELYLLSNNGSRLRRIWAMRRDGTGLRIVLNDYPHLIWTLGGVGAGRVYFTDQSSPGILSIAAEGGGELRLEFFGGTEAPDEVSRPCTVVGGEIYMYHRPRNAIIRVRLADNRMIEAYSGEDMNRPKAIAVLP